MNLNPQQFQEPRQSTQMTSPSLLQEMIYDCTNTNREKRQMYQRIQQIFSPANPSHTSSPQRKIKPSKASAAAEPYVAQFGNQKIASSLSQQDQRPEVSSHVTLGETKRQSIDPYPSNPEESEDEHQTLNNADVGTAMTPMASKIPINNRSQSVGGD